MVAHHGRRRAFNVVASVPDRRSASREPRGDMHRSGPAACRPTARPEAGDGAARARRPLRLLAFNDLHGSDRELEALAGKASVLGLDAVLCAGDFTAFGHHAAKVLRRLAEARRPFLLAPGNHENDDLLDSLRADFPSLCNVNGRWVHLGSAWVCGFGGPRPFERDLTRDDRDPHPELLALWRGCPDDVKRGRLPFVLLSHYPPLRTALDHTAGGAPGGSAQVRAFIESLAPALVVCGHQHEGFGKEDRIGPSRIVNPGPTGREFVV
jgi:Icc-related predicted phosphoesterase